MTKREPGLDLLRCLAFLLVVVYHSFLFNGFFYQSQTGAAMWLADSVRWFSASCNGIFMMLTGYLRTGNTSIRSSCRSMGSALLGYLLASIITIPIRHFAFGDVQTFSVWITRLFSFSAVYYGWYVEMYIGLVLLSPFVNMVLERLRGTRQLLIFAAVMLLLTALPGATPLGIVPDYWRSLYPLTYYVLGGVIRRIQPKISPWVGILGAVAVALLLGGATVLSTDGGYKEGLSWDFPDIFIVMICLGLFLAFYRLQIPPTIGKGLAFCAGGCFGGYLLSHLLDGWCYRLVSAWHKPAYYPLITLCISIPIFLCSILGGRLLQKLTDRLLGKGKKTSALQNSKNLP